MKIEILNINSSEVIHIEVDQNNTPNKKMEEYCKEVHNEFKKTFPSNKIIVSTNTKAYTG